MPSRNKIKIPAWIAEELFETEGEILEDPANESSELWIHVSNQEGDQRRWMRSWNMIVKRRSDGRFFAIHYEVGLTENQCSEYPWKPDWRDAPDSVDAIEVYPQPI